MNAQTSKTWNFSDWTTETISATKTQDGLTVVATTDKSVSIDGNKKTIEGTEYTQRLKLGGTGSEDARNLNFAVTGACTIKVGLTSSSGSGEPRTLVVANGFGNELGSMNAPAGSAVQGTYSYTGDAATIYLYSKSSGINLYYITVDYSTAPTAIEQVEISEKLSITKNLISNPEGLKVSVFDVSGKLVSVSNSDIDMGAAPAGVYVVRAEGLKGALKFGK